MASRLANFVAFQLSWLACVAGAGQGLPWLGPLVVAGFVAGHLYTRAPGEMRRAEARLLISAAAIGYLADSALVLGGQLGFPPHASLGWPSSAWMVALWVALAATLSESMAWMSGRYLVAGVFGAIGGPLAYLAGVRLGAAALGPNQDVALAAVAVEWGVAMPILVWLAGRTPQAASAFFPWLPRRR